MNIPIIFKIFSSRDLENNPLSFEDFQKIISISENIKLFWGGEYMIFFNNYYTTIFEESPEKQKVFNGIYPIKGSSNLFGLEKPQIHAKLYSSKEFYEIVKTSTSIQVETSEENLKSISDILPEVQLTNYINYSGIITFLEERGVVTTKSSENYIVVDPRIFCLNSNSINDKYINQYYEVDSLGTNFFQDLTLHIHSLYEHLKDIPFTKTS